MTRTPRAPRTPGELPTRRTAARLLLAPAALAAAAALPGTPAHANPAARAADGGIPAVPAVPDTAASTADHVWESSDQWATYTTEDGYTLYNNLWGSGAGTQTIWVDSSSSWGVVADHPDTGGVKAYPNAKKVVDTPLPDLSSLTTGYDVSVPASGAYNTSYDIWDTAYAYEVMLWVNWTGPVGPIGSRQTTVSLGGSEWAVYRGDNGSNQVFSFLRTSNSTSGTVDVLPVLKWLEEQGWWSGVTIGDVQFGYEITSSSGGLEFTTNGFGVSHS